MYLFKLLILKTKSFAMKPRIRTILISGGTGLIGRALSSHLAQNGYQVHILTRKPELFHNQKNINYFGWDWKHKKIDEKALENIDAFIHLAGANIAKKKWTEKYKAEIAGSRILSLRFIREKLREKNIKLKAFAGASAIGYYGCTTDDVIRFESHNPGQDFLSRVVTEWEKESMNMRELTETFANLRTGIVWSSNGGALPKMLRPVVYNLTSALGSGQQWINWIHIDDIVGIYRFIIEERKSGIFNAVAPHHIRYDEFIRIAAGVLSKNCCFPNIPSWFIRLLYGEMACLFLEGVPISPQKLENTGYEFAYIHPARALRDLIKER